MKKKIILSLVCLLIASLCLSVFVGAQKNPADSISLPAALISGHTYDLQQPDLQLTVNGESCNEPIAILGEVGAATQMELRYADSEGNEVAAYTLPVVDTNGSLNRCAYFYDQTGKVTVKENKDDISLSFSQDAEISFINLLSADEFAIQFTEQTTNYEAITLKLTATA